MKDKAKAQKPAAEETPRARVVQQLLDLAHLIRRRGSAEEAAVAAEFEQQLAKELETAAA